MIPEVLEVVPVATRETPGIMPPGSKTNNATQQIALRSSKA